MTILPFCTECKSYVAMSRNKRKKCRHRIGAVKKFRINLPTPSGKRRTRVINGPLSYAKKVEAKLKVEIMQERDFGIKKAPLIHDTFKEYAKWAERYKKDPKMVLSRWKNHIEQYIPDSWTMDKLTASDINKILDRMRQKGGRDGNGCAPATIKHVLGLIKRLYNWADENDLYDGPNPAAKIKSPSLDNCVTNYLSKFKLARLRMTLKRWPNQRAALIVLFALYTGCRRGELFKLIWVDIDLQNKLFKLRDPKGKSATLPINNKAFNVLLQAKELNKKMKSKWVFPNRYGQQRKHIGSTWERIKRKASLPKDFRFHDLRHTFATYLASSGEVDIYTLQKLLNHQSPAMTQRYAHLTNDALKRGSEKIDEIKWF